MGGTVPAPMSELLRHSAQKHGATGATPNKALQKLQAYRERKKALATQGIQQPHISHAQKPVQGTAQRSAQSLPPPPSGQPAVERSNTPSGVCIEALFPHAAYQAPPSRFGQLVQSRPSQQRASACGVLAKQSEADVERLRAVFSELSPDDRVLQARAGTRLVD